TPPVQVSSPRRRLCQTRRYAPKPLKVPQSTLRLAGTGDGRTSDDESGGSLVIDEPELDASPASPESLAGEAATSSSSDPGVVRRIAIETVGESTGDTEMTSSDGDSENAPSAGTQGGGQENSP
ncbi:unnamed protein product, partial [Ixodes hexagonus]